MTSGRGYSRERTDGAWLGWTSASIAVAVGAVYGLALLGLVGIELGLTSFAAAIAWTALTPRVIRRLGRWVARRG